MRIRIIREYEFDDYMAVKDELSREELCNLLFYIKHEYLPDYKFSGTEEDFENYKLQMAIYKAIDYISGRNPVIFSDK